MRIYNFLTTWTYLLARSVSMWHDKLLRGCTTTLPTYTFAASKHSRRRLTRRRCRSVRAAAAGRLRHNNSRCRLPRRCLRVGQLQETLVAGQQASSSDFWLHICCSVHGGFRHLCVPVPFCKLCCDATAANASSFDQAAPPLQGLCNYYSWHSFERNYS